MPQWNTAYEESQDSARGVTDDWIFKDTYGQDVAIPHPTTLDALLNNWLSDSDKNYQLQKSNLLQSIMNQQIVANRQAGGTLAAHTGGRAGYQARATNDIGGQYAMALQSGLAQLAQQKLQDKWRLLQAYIQKYGIDKNAEMALEQLKAQEDSALMGGISSFLGNIGSLGMLKLLKII